MEGENYLLPVDARLSEEIDLDFEALELRAVLRQMRGRANLVFLDACRDNPLAQDLARSMGADRSATIGRGLGRVDAGSGTLIAYATEPGNTAADGTGRNSPFTAALLRHIAVPGRSVNDMLTAVSGDVAAATDNGQQPWTHSSLRAPFYFAQAVPEPEPAAGGVSPASPPTVAAAPFDRLTAEQLAAERLAAEQELLFWETVKDSANAANVQAYLDRWPNGQYAVLARNLLEQLAETAGGVAPPRDMPARPAAAPVPQPDPEGAEAALGLWRSDRRAIQAGLASLGFDPGPADGLFGGRTRAALSAWQAAKGEAATGWLTAAEAGVLKAAGEEALLVLAEREREERAARAEAEAERQARAAAERRAREEAERAARAEAEAERQRRAAEERRAREEAERAARAEAEAERRRRAAAERRAREEAEREARARAEAERRARAAAERRARERAEAERERDLARKWPAGKVFRDCDGCPVMVVVPAGSFTMGSPVSEKGRGDDEGPQRRVTFSRLFAVGKFEVSFAEWDACVAAGGCNGYRPDDEGWGRDRHPVINVSWNDAQAYVGWLSRKTGQKYRLLSESEWEYAARAGTRSSRYWGDGTSDQCAHANGVDWAHHRQYSSEGDRVHGRPYSTRPMARCEDGYVHASRVGSFSANGFGLHDMSGNVWEFVEDCWHDSYARAPSDGGAWTTGGDCSLRVLRGGSWNDGPRALRSANRTGSRSGIRSGDRGFRVARPLVP